MTLAGPATPMDAHAPDPLTAPDRLVAVRATGIACAAAVAALDELAAEAAAELGAPVAVVSLIDDEREFCPGAVGLPEPLDSDRQVLIPSTLCRFLVSSGDIFQVDNGPEDERVAESWAIREGGVVAYLGVPIRSGDWHVIGGFCAADSRPRSWSDRDRAVLTRLGLVAEHFFQRLTQEHGVS
jgi:GAF domain-containing protein